MTQKQLAANRRNSLKSTGPKTATGKSCSSRNSLKHGVLAEAPVLQGVESQKSWEQHRDGLFESFAPVGYFEELLTAQLASLLWRLVRVARYEARVGASTIATAETDLDTEERDKWGPGKPADPKEARANAEQAARLTELLQALPDFPDDKKLDHFVASAALILISEQLPEDAAFVSVPGIPDENAAFLVFDGWTAALLRKGLEAYADVAQMDPEALLSQCLTAASDKQDEARQAEHKLATRGRQWEVLLERAKNTRLLLQPDVLEKVTRYESSLERSFFRTLHELQRVQAARSGANVPPPAALDVDVTVHQGRPD
jgi:hypothetical protein